MAIHPGKFIALGLAGLLLAVSPAWSTVIVKQSPDGWTVSITGGWKDFPTLFARKDLTFHDKALADNAAKYLNEAEDLAVKNDKAGFDHAMMNLKAVADIADKKFRAAVATFSEAVTPIADEIGKGLKKPSILDYQKGTAGYEKFLKDESDYYKEYNSKVQKEVDKDPKLAALDKARKIALDDFNAGYSLNEYADNKRLFDIIRWYYEDQATKQDKPPQQLVAPQNTTPPDKNTKNGQTSAPKSCGDIIDQAMLVAMGCTPAPQNRAVAVTGAQTVPARDRSGQTGDCFSDPLCVRELEARERASGTRDAAAPRMPMAGAPMPGGAMPGGPMSGPGRY